MTGSSDQNTTQEETNPRGFRRCSHTFLSKERIQKFNLLLHLISNISGPIVVRGPDGIGKSTVLKEVKSHSLDTWSVCFAEAWSDLNLDRMRQMLSTTASLSVSPSSFDNTEDGLDEQLKWMEENSLLLVLLLDDADTVAPGLLKSLRQFAESYPALRLVYSMKPENSPVMDTNDVGTRNCHFVDLPSLTEQQCREFIEILSTDPQRPKSFPTITPSFIHRVYKETHGIPGEILKVLAITSKTKSHGEENKFSLRSVSIAVLILSVIGLFVWMSSFQDQFFSKKPALSKEDGRDKKKLQFGMPSVSGSTTLGKTDKPNVSVEKTINNENIAEVGKSQASDTQSTIKIPHGGISEIKESIAPQKTKIKKKKPQKQSLAPQQTKVNQLQEEARLLKPPDRASPGPSKKLSHDLGLPGIRGTHWLLNQKPTKWTVQLIAVSQLGALKSLVGKHSDLQPLAAIRSRANDKEFFSLYYGSYNTLDEAKIAIKKLPPFFNKPWPIMFQVVHGKIKP